MLADTDNLDPEEDDAWFNQVFGYPGDTTDTLQEALSPDGEEVEDFQDWELDMDDEVLCDELLEIGMENGDNADDEEWVPPAVKRKRERRKQDRKGMWLML